MNPSDIIRTEVHKLTALSAEKRGVAMVAVLVAEDDLAPMEAYLARRVRDLDVVGATELRDVVRRFLAAVEAAK